MSYALYILGYLVIGIVLYVLLNFFGSWIMENYARSHNMLYQSNWDAMMWLYGMALIIAWPIVIPLTLLIVFLVGVGSLLMLVLFNIKDRVQGVR